MNGSRYRQASDTQGESKRVPRPYDQADIDGEPVEYGCSADVAFFIPSGSPEALANGDAARGAADVTGHTGRYGDVAASSIGDDSERERDA